MGACGCSEGVGDVRFPGPDGSIYTARVYPGCRDCETPAGVDIQRFDPSLGPMFEEAFELPEADFGDATGYGIIGLPVLHPAKLEEALRVAASGAAEEGEASAADLVDFVEDATEEAFRAAVQATADDSEIGTAVKR